MLVALQLDTIVLVQKLYSGLVDLRAGVWTFFETEKIIMKVIWRIQNHSPKDVQQQQEKANLISSW